MARLAVNSVETVEGGDKSEHSEVTVTQLQKALESCMKEMAEMRKAFGTVKGLPTQQNAAVPRGSRPPFNQARGAPTANRNLRPRVPNAQGAGGYRGPGPRQQNFVLRGSMQCFRCKQLGHIAPHCSNNPVSTTTERRPPVTNGMSSGATNTVVKGEQSRVQQAVNLKELRDVYIPIQLYNRKMSALLDTGCDTSIIGARLLPPGTHIEPTLQTLTAANGTPIPVEGIVMVQFKIGGRKQFVQAIVTKAVHEMILGIDFLIDADVDWRFSQGKVKLGEEWIQLHKRQRREDVQERKPP